MTITLGSSCPIGLVASRFGISGVQRMPPQPKGQVNPDIYLPLFARLEASHPALHEVLLTAIRNKVDGNPSVFWSDPLASAVAVSSNPWVMPCTWTCASSASSNRPTPMSAGAAPWMIFCF